MTQTWECADARPSLGVYVLGAIEPAERSLVDAHLMTCRDCRTNWPAWRACRLCWPG